MKTTSNAAYLSALVGILFFLSGCAGDGSDDGSLPQDPAQPVDPAEPTEPPPPPPPPPPPRGETYHETFPLQPNASPTAPGMTVETEWGNLTFVVRLVTTAQCSTVTGDPPGGGNDPVVTFTSPSSAAVAITWPEETECTLGTNNEWARHNATAPNEVGQWTVQIQARGTGADVEIIVEGS